MGLVERRIGLLFAVFLGMLLLAGARAGWLGIVRANSLQSAAATQQKADIVVPARRGTITRRQRDRARDLQARADDRRDAVPDRRPGEGRRQLARILRRPEDELLRKLARRDTGFVYIARRVPTKRALRAQELGVEGLEFIPEYSREYPRDWMASQLLGNVGTDGAGLSGLEYRFDAPPARAATASAGSSATRSATRSSCARTSARVPARTCGSRSTRTSRTTPRRCSTRSARRGSRRAPRRS